MSRVVIDIETLGYPIGSFDKAQQDYLLKFSETEKEKFEVIQNGKILFQSDSIVDEVSTDGMIHFLSGSEKELLETLWQDLTHYRQFITFNGRGFDCPFLMLRSSILQVQPSRHLMPYRYDAAIHCDLLDQFTFYGALRKFNLDFYCKSFGIESPKSHGITGLDLGELFRQKRFKEIAEYNLGDLQATAELYRRWDRFLNI
jgi:uncharacterized protein YprB with RNaseH-like and TPR domain